MSVAPPEVWAIPRRTTLGPSPSLGPPTGRRWSFLGLGYALATVSLSIYALQLLQTYLENDLIWPQFRALALQPVLVDAFNLHLTLLPSTAHFELLASALAVPSSGAPVFATYPRLALYTDSLPLTDVVIGLRQVGAGAVTHMMAQYCYVDLRRRWELAHTAQRQARCAEKHATNAAVHLEAVLRNIDMPAWLGLYAGFFLPLIGDAVSPAFVQALVNHTWAPVEDEARLWSAHGYEVFVLNWANLRQLGLVETIRVENELGAITTLHIKAIAPVDRYALWTSHAMFASFENDLGNFLLGPNMSLVRNAPNWYGYILPFAMEIYSLPYPLNTLNQALHDHLGSLGSVDLWMLRPPPSLLAYVAAYQHHLQNAKQASSDVATALDAFETTVLHPTPRAWQSTDLVFLGGNPMCAFGAPCSFVQESFGFDDTCATQRPWTSTWTSTSILFALSIESNHGIDVAAICHSSGLVLAEAASCQRTLSAAMAIYNRLPPLAQFNVTGMMADVEGLTLSTLQFVQNISSSSSAVDVRSQLLLPHDALRWRVFGWTSLFEWALGQREAVAFEGDMQTFHLLSYAYAPIDQFVNPLDVGLSLSGYLFNLCAYLTFGLCVALSALLLAAMSRRHHLFFAHGFLFNRVASTTWVGRPMLLVRALAAIVCLATASVSVQQLSTTGDRTFVATPRSLLESAILSGETLWLSYALDECLCHASSSLRMRKYVPWTAMMAFCVCWFLDVVASPQLAASLGRQCKPIAMDTYLMCDSGVVQVGHRTRVYLLIAVHVGLALLGVLWSQCLVQRRTSGESSVVPSVVLHGAATTYMGSPDATARSFDLDQLSAILCGLLIFEVRGTLYVGDVALWRVLPATMYGIRRFNDVYIFPATRQYAQTAVLAFGPPSPPSIALPTLSRPSAVAMAGALLPKTTPLALVHRVAHASVSLVGLLYVSLSLFANATYMTVTSPRVLANDFYWGNFNSSGGHTLNRLLATDHDAQAAFFSLPRKQYIGPFPSDFASPGVAYTGGNLLCGDDQAGSPMVFSSVDSTPIFRAFSATNACYRLVFEFFQPDPFLVLFALSGFHTAAELSNHTLLKLCEWDYSPGGNCNLVYESSRRFLLESSSVFADAASVAAKVAADVDALEVQFVQYLRNGSSHMLYHRGILDAAKIDISWIYFGWCFSYAWAAGTREVVSFQGDARRVTAISGPLSPLTIQPNPAEIPQNFSFVLMACVQYITCVFVVLAAGIAVLTLRRLEHCEGRHLFQMNRMIGLVWIGWPFLLLRSLTAMVLLHTSSLTLTQVGGLARFTSPALPWYSLVLVSGEVNWLVYVLNDLFSIATTELTHAYANHSAVLTWILMLLWISVAPCQHAATLQRACTSINMDDRLECHSASIRVGQFSRLPTTLAIALGSLVVTYSVARWRHRTLRPSPPSAFLSSPAKYMFVVTDWCVDGVLYLDAMSALLAGLLSFEMMENIVILDVKKWRLLVVARRRLGKDAPPHLRHAIPLLE
ncbi:hypothetical protein SDRG_16623 [Saprolegnia diclina VS20]|uniref:Uncharacterized protein n=1 Tax=Saprolegnia diclina (strain VS20) TaxID=1156394 RepID=T0PJG1_SAPDV|nr:hypothetical protein SDRG_16623 [Saprolegnia diclina VS20]EQC25499.1 hypothetical protein SDRG_16623 [Saprolegnia diclina VS20]|eukprot:XP_008621063.1 hypothetical protein SDRG_16623 [Saprolegnia diclina VS20]